MVTVCAGAEFAETGCRAGVGEGRQAVLRGRRRGQHVPPPALPPATTLAPPAAEPSVPAPVTPAPTPTEPRQHVRLLPAAAGSCLVVRASARGRRVPGPLPESGDRRVRRPLRGGRHPVVMSPRSTTVLAGAENRCGVTSYSKRVSDAP